MMGSILSETCAVQTSMRIRGICGVCDADRMVVALIWRRDRRDQARGLAIGRTVNPIRHASFLRRIRA
ncbi:hypothetical protein EP30_06370 [Bifidobacterium sp. UTCIF-39]|nr:hypothetical protein EP30_06370 [Bifidobacterium sp. UTCIF-39]